MMMAQAIGIGTGFSDLIPPACNRVPEIRNLLGLEDHREIYASITMGYSKYRNAAKVTHLTSVAVKHPLLSGNFV
jgi:hypothetical protein